MAEFLIDVTQRVRVTLDETKFTEGFMEEFRGSFYPLFELRDHAEHIAQLQARNVIDLETTPEFVEGYGPSDEMGIKAQVIETVTEVA